MNTATAMRLQIIAEHDHTRITNGALDLRFCRFIRPASESEAST